MLMQAWAERLELHDLVEKVASTCRRMRVDKLIIENKAAGHSVAQELRRLFGHEDWGVQLLDPKGQDKLARLYSVQHLFAEGMVYSPDRSWADQVISQVGTFPKGKHDDLVDTVSQAIRHMRDLGLLTRGPEWTASIEEGMVHRGAAPAPLYPA
jgi:predicted phage terminase large subunit-like protein